MRIYVTSRRYNLAIYVHGLPKDRAKFRVMSHVFSIIKPAADNSPREGWCVIL